MYVSYNSSQSAYAPPSPPISQSWSSELVAIVCEPFFIQISVLIYVSPLFYIPHPSLILISYEPTELLSISSPVSNLNFVALPNTRQFISNQIKGAGVKHYLQKSSINSFLTTTTTTLKE